MIPFRSYLLYTRSQELAFRDKYGKLVDESLQKYEAWFYSKPLYEWTPVTGILPKTAEFQIGMICELVWTGKANLCIDFPPDGGVILMRYARDEAEYKEYFQTHFSKPIKQTIK